MELRSAIKKRFSCRKFKKKDVSDEKLKEIIELGLSAPSINDSKPWKFIVVKNREVLKEMADAVERRLEELDLAKGTEDNNFLKEKVKWFSTFFKNVPAVIVVLVSDYEAEIDKISPNIHNSISSLRNSPEIQSLGACVQNMLLTAEDLGLASCWLSAPVIANEEFQKILDFDGKEWKTGAMAAIGYSDMEKNNNEVEEADVVFIK